MKERNIILELAWEAVQDVYTTYANIYAYQHLKDFCSFGEDTYLIKIKERSIQAFYDVSEVGRQSEFGLRDFLNPVWRTLFKTKAEKAIERTGRFVKKCRLKSEHSKEELFGLIKEGTEINNELFIAFAACQPQYTALVETYIKNLMPNQLGEEGKDHAFLTLTQSEKSSPLTTEVIDSEKIRREKTELISTYQIPEEVIVLCNEISEMGHLRLLLRIEGWMLLENILMQELFPQLPKYLPYTTQQLEVTVPEELARIFEGNNFISPEDLNERYEFFFCGLLSGEEVRWQGEQAREMSTKLIPSIDTSIRELEGQIGWRGKIQGNCFVIHWDAEDVTLEIANMPEGSILIAGQTRPELMPAIQKASAIVTDEGGLLSHAAIVARELKKPCVIGTKFATKVFKTGDLVEVDAEKGIVRVLERKT
jgi:pyruvate,water dikinase